MASAFLHAAWNAVIKADKDTTTAGVVVLALAGCLAGILTLLQPGAAFPQTQAIWWTLLSGVFETSYFLSLIWCLSRGSLGQVYSLSRGGALLVVWPLSVLIFGEPVLGAHLVGGVAVFAGLLLTGHDRDAEVPTRSLLWPLMICAGSIAGYHLLYKQALLYQAQPMAVFALSMLVAAPANLFWHRQALKARWHSLRWGPLTVAGLLCTASFVLTLVALGQAGAGWVLTLRNTSVIFALFFSWRMREPVPPQRIWGTACIAIGAVLLGWG